jgi:signal transduction histidine kinase
VSGIDEVAHLAVAFNRMAAELEQVDRSRRDFVADAAHELRTPVSALRAQLENAVDGVETLDPRALLDQVERLGRLTDQLLDLSRLEEGATPLVPRTFVVAELIDGHGIAADVPAGLEAHGDPDRLAQVLVNLVDNAHRHGGAPVTVRARARPSGGVVLEVEDRGPGLPADADRLFDRFARADPARSTSGAGLGLAIARSIVELHGGSLRAEAAEPHGCRMVVELPQHTSGAPPGRT